MKRDEWIQRYAARRVARGSWMTAEQARDVAVAGADSTEAAGGRDPNMWAAPETVADEHLASERESDDDASPDEAVCTPFSTDEGKWYVANGFGRVVAGPYDTAEEAGTWIARTRPSAPNGG